MAIFGSRPAADSASAPRARHYWASQARRLSAPDEMEQAGALQVVTARAAKACTGGGSLAAIWTDSRGGLCVFFVFLKTVRTVDAGAKLMVRLSNNKAPCESRRVSKGSKFKIPSGTTTRRSVR